MTEKQLKVLDLAIPYLSPPTLSPLERPSLRYSTLLKLSLLSRSIHSHVESRLYAEIFISAGNSQLVPLLKAIMSNKSLAQQINKLSFVSRHKQVEKWDLDRIEKIVEMCTEVRELVIAIPTTFGLKENFFSSTSLANLNSLTLATPIRPSISSPTKPPLFNLTTLSILPPFNSSFTLSFTPTLNTLLAPRYSLQDEENTCSLSKLVNLSLSDSRRHPLKVPPLLAPTVSSTLTSLALPRFTHSCSYESTLQGEFGIREAREQPRFSCDPPISLHPSRKFLDHFSSRTVDSKLKYVYLANLGHLGTIHHLPKSVEVLIIGPSRLKEERELEELQSCLCNTKAELRQVGALLRRRRKIRKEGESEEEMEKSKRIEERLRRIAKEVSEKRHSRSIELRWV